MKKFIVTCTMIHNGTMFVDAENNFEALGIAQNKLYENVDCINWDFGEATADYAEEEVILDGDVEEDNPTTPQPKYKVGDVLVSNDNIDINFTIVGITDDGEYECSDGEYEKIDDLDYSEEYHLAEDWELKIINGVKVEYPKYKVGDYIVSECGTIYKVIRAENGSYIAENKYGDERCHFDDDNGVFNFRLATPDEVNVYKNQTHPRYKVGDIVKSDNSPADKIVRVNSETYFFESGEYSDITVLDDDATFYLVQPPKYKVGDYVGDYHYGYYQITAIKDGKYVFDDGDEVPIEIFDADENHHIETFHREDFLPFDKVLVRDVDCTWVADFFSHNDEHGYATSGGLYWEQCVPYNSETAHLLGTTAEYNGKYKTW